MVRATTFISTVTPSASAPALNNTPSAPIISSSTWTFTQGFVLGQASFLILIGVFIKYVVFESAEKNRQRKLDRGKRPPLSTTNVPSPSSIELMEKVDYDMASHASESSDFLNVLLAQILQGYRDDLLGSGGEEGARRRVESWLNPANNALSWLDPISVTSLNLGNSYPILSNARIRPADGQGGIRLEIDIDYSDSLHLSLATSLLVNFPLPKFAVLPVALGVELVGFGGTLSIRILNPPGENQQQQVHMSLLPDFHLNVKTTSLLGSRAKLQDIPKLEQLVVSRLRAVIHDKLVWPRYIEFSLPRLRGLHTEETEGIDGKPLTDISKPRMPSRHPDTSPSLHVTTPSMHAPGVQQVVSSKHANMDGGEDLTTSPQGASPRSRQIRMPADFRSNSYSSSHDPTTVSVHGFAAAPQQRREDLARRSTGGMSSVIELADTAGLMNGQMRYRGGIAAASGGGATPSMSGSLPLGHQSSAAAGGQQQPQQHHHVVAGHASGPASLAGAGRVGGALNARNTRVLAGNA